MVFDDMLLTEELLTIIPMIVQDVKISLIYLKIILHEQVSQSASWYQ